MTEKANEGRFSHLPATLDLPQMKAGEVWIVGAGAGDAGGLTLHALNGLQQADVVLHDSLVAPAVLALASGELIYVGKRAHANQTRKQKDISAHMIELAQTGKKVLRLKGGDPGIFGRGGEEAAALQAAGVPFRFFAGITAALAAAHQAGVSLTHREQNQGVALITGHAPESINWQALSESANVIAIYMPLDYGKLQSSMLAAGKEPSEPVAVVSHAGLGQEEVIHTTLAQLGDITAAPPALVIVGAKKW